MASNEITLAWTGTDQRLNVLSHRAGKVTLGETSGNQPSLAVHGDRLYLAWTGTDQRLNVVSSADGKTFSGKVTLDETSPDGPFLKSDGRQIYLAWTGTDQRLNELISKDGGKSWGDKSTSHETSGHSPALATF